MCNYNVTNTLKGVVKSVV